jgi:hypothetical protein
MNRDTVREIGIWGLRVVLVVGAVYAAGQNKNDVAGSLITALVLSFLFL